MLSGIVVKETGHPIRTLFRACGRHRHCPFLARLVLQLQFEFNALLSVSGGVKFVLVSVLERLRIIHDTQKAGPKGRRMSGQVHGGEPENMTLDECGFVDGVLGGWV